LYTIDVSGRRSGYRATLHQAEVQTVTDDLHADGEHPFQTPSLTAERSPTQTDRVLLTLRRMVLTGQFRSGERLTELDLVARLNASRTPVRHALIRLAHEGLLEALPKGFRVCAFTLDEVWDAIELRGVLEGTAARLTAERLSHPGELAELLGIQSDSDNLLPLTADNFAQYLEFNEAFHHELMVLSKSPILMRTLDGILRLPFASPGALVLGDADQADVAQTAVLAKFQHRAIIDAIQQRAGTRAEHLALEHARIARGNLERALRDPAIFSRLPGASLVTLDGRSGSPT
jgi:GntR family transcriptional regulator of vanillate catabolism